MLNVNIISICKLLQSESDLIGLVQMMIIIFGEQPPVYSVAGQSQSNNPTSSYPAAAGNNLNNLYFVRNCCTYIKYFLFAGYPPYPNSGTAYPPATPYPPYPPVASSNPTPYPSYTTPGYPSYGNTNAGYPTYPVAGAAAGPASTPHSTGTISEDHIRASLLSAVEDKVWIHALTLFPFYLTYFHNH